MSTPAPVTAKTCANCGVPLLGPFCHACGQPEKGLVRHFGGIIGDFLDSVLSWDSRTLKTLWPLLFRPGVLTLEYFAGRRVRYVTPLRLYVFISVILFLVLPMVTQVETGEPLIETGSAFADDVAQAEHALAEATSDLESLKARRDKETRADRQIKLDQRLIKATIELELARVQLDAARVRKAEGIELTGPPAPKDSGITLIGGQSWDRIKNPLTIGFLSEETNTALNIEIERTINNLDRANREPGALVEGIFAALPYAMFVLLPVFALLLKILYLFKRRYYVEHLIVALHSHSFLFLQILVVVVLAQFFNLPDLAESGAGQALAWTMGLAIGWMPLYLLIMQKRVYRQGWFFTLIKYTIIGSVYSVLLTLAMLGAFIAGLHGL